MTDDDLTLTVEVTRGTGTDDRDKLRAKVTANTVDELEQRAEDVRQRMESLADDLREIQPENTRQSRRLSDDQTEFGEVSEA